MLGPIRRVLFPFRPFHPFFSIPLIALTLAACAGRPPVGEMAGADVAISAAKAAGAEERAPVEFILAKYLFEESVRDVESLSYGRARDNAVEARRVALEAEDLARRAGRRPVLKGRRAAEEGDPASRSVSVAAIPSSPPASRTRKMAGTQQRRLVPTGVTGWSGARVCGGYPATPGFIMTLSSGRSCMRPTRRGSPTPT